MDKGISRASLDNPANRAVELTRPVHHSPADWNYQPARGFHLSGAQYISGPTALCRPVDATQGDRGWVFLKEGISGNLSEGRITNYTRWSNHPDRNIYFFFRTQAQPSNDLPLNCYWFQRGVYAIQLFKRVAGVDTGLKGVNGPAQSWDTWYHHRLTWYIWLTQTLDPILRVLWDEWVTGAWLNYINFDIANPLWQGTPTNLIGMQLRGNSLTNRHWIDNTLIYRRSA